MQPANAKLMCVRTMSKWRRVDVARLQHFLAVFAEPRASEAFEPCSSHSHRSPSQCILRLWGL